MTAENTVDVPTGGVDDTDLHCALCDTDLEPGMDTIMRLEDFPGTVFCDRCEPLISLGIRTVGEASVLPLRDRTRKPHTVTRLVVFSALAAIAIAFAGAVVIAGTFLAGLIFRP